jgi:hypothetical protein
MSKAKSKRMQENLTVPKGSYQPRTPPRALPYPSYQRTHDVTFVTARKVTHTEVYGEAAGGQVVGEATSLYDKHRKPNWNPWHPFANAFDYQQARALGTQSKTWVNDYLRRGLDDFRTTSFQTASELWELLRCLDFGLGAESWLQAPGKYGNIYCRDIFKCIQFLLGHLPFAEHLDFAPVQLYDSANHRIYSEMNSGDWWWETQEQLPDGATIVPVIFASDKTHLTNFSGDKSAWPLYMSIGNIQKDVRRAASKRAWILVGFIPVPPKGATDIDSSWHHAIHTILKPLREVDISGTGYEWDCADGFKRTCYPLLAAWIGDYPEIAMITKIVGGACPVCEVPKGPEMGHGKGFRNWEPRCTSRYQEHLEENRLDEFKEVHLQPTSNLFWDYPLCNVYRLWQPDALHQLYLGIVKDLFNWLLEYLTDRGLKAEFDARFTSVPHYPNMLRFSKPFDALKNGSWHGKEIREMLRSLSAVCAPLLSSDVAGKTISESASDTEVMKTIRALIEFSLLASQRTHSDISLKYLDEALESFYKCKQIFTPQHATEARTRRLESDFQAQAAKLKEVAMEKIERELHREIYGITTGQRRTFEVHLKEEQLRATTWNAEERATTMVRLEAELYGASTDQLARFGQLFKEAQDRLELKLRPEASRGPTSKFARELERERHAIMTAVFGASKVTVAAKREFERRLLEAEKAATHWSEERQQEVARCLEIEVYGASHAAQAAFRHAMTEKRLKYDQEWDSRKGPNLRKQLTLQFYHFGKPKMHLLCHYREFITRMGAPDNFSTEISELLHISNVKEAYRASNGVNFMLQLLQHNDRYTAMDYMEHTLRWLALYGWYVEESAVVLNMMTGREKRQMTRCARQKRILAGESEPLIRPSTQPLRQFKLSTICARSRSFKRISLAEAAATFNIPTLPSLVRQHLHEIWGRDAVSVIWGYGNEFKEDVTLQPHNKVAFYTPEFHNPQQMKPDPARLQR